MSKSSLTRKQEYVRCVTHGGGFMPWQRPGLGRRELEFRRRIEARKDRMLRVAAKVRHPVMLSERELAQARRNIKRARWAREWFDGLKATSDYVARQPDGYVEAMIPELTPWVGYTFFCPNCYGVKSFEGQEYTIIEWDFRKPDTIRCKCCGQVYPSDRYPETGALQCPRSGQTLTFYLNDEERRHPRDRSGRHAWHWAMRPVHPCFSGIVREHKILFMIRSARALALVYRLTGEAHYAQRAARILLRFTHCFRHKWLYHDYWDVVADCDPLYAAWHDKELPLEWKRSLFTSAYEKDTRQRASMLQSYWGAGRLHPSTDVINLLPDVCLTYDLLCKARGSDGLLLLPPEARRVIEKDLILEWMIEAEPFAGGSGKAAATHNKAPRLYRAMAAVARCLGITQFADTALRGYEAIRDNSFLFDGFSRETPSYNDMYLHELLWTAESLHCFRWPQGCRGRRGIVNLYRTDPKLAVMLRARIDELRPDGRTLPHGDSHQSSVTERHGSHILEVGLKRFPDHYAARLPVIYRHRRSKPTEYAVLHLDSRDFGPGKRPGRSRDLSLPEVFFPGWMTAILRHGRGMDATIFSMVFNPPGGHRHYDNLAVFYETGSRTILGDHGYLAEAPAQRWVKDTFSHNLVVVDDRRQLFTTDGPRKPSLHMMATSPGISVVEGSSQCYKQCTDYRRLAALVKGPGAETFVVDIFRVKGGRKHDYRIFSEVASSDAGRRGRLEFAGIHMPPEPPLPQVGASERLEDIYGLRDVREVKRPPAGWQAAWSEKGRRYRLWMLSRVGACLASNGPGQETWVDPRQIGRRVRYVDAVNTGRDLASTFVAVHEPGGPHGAMPIREAELLPVPACAGPDAVAVSIWSKWGQYLLFSDFEDEAEVEGTRFRGKFGVTCLTPAGRRWLLSIGASTLKGDDFGFSDAPAMWSGKIERSTGEAFTPSTGRPAGWPAVPRGVTTYVLVGDGEQWTGFPVRKTEKERILVERFPLPKAARFQLSSVRFQSP